MQDGIGIPHTDSERQRAFDALAQAVDHELDDDRRWFRDNPRHSIRVRKSFSNELRLQQLAEGLDIPAGHRAYTLVRQLSPGYRVRQFHVAKRNFMPPVTNMGGMRLWRDVADDKVLSDGTPLDAFCTAVEADLKANPPATTDTGEHTTLLLPFTSMQGVRR